jgi:hypothetical protein
MVKNWNEKRFEILERKKGSGGQSKLTDNEKKH